jgi:uncharacterized protein (UPF0276 family)
MTSAPELPAGVGLGLRPEHWDALVAGEGQVDFLELLLDDWLPLGPTAARRRLRPLMERCPLVAHGIHLSIGSAEGLDGGYLDRVARLLDALEIEVYSEHLAFRRAGGLTSGQFLPLTPTPDRVDLVVANLRQVEQATGRRPVLENVAYLLASPHTGLGPSGLLREVVERAGCGLLLDLTNLLVDAANHSLDPEDLLADLPLDRVTYAHVAGGHRRGGFEVDSHSSRAPVPVLRLLARLVREGHIRSVLLERDRDVPPLAELGDELAELRGALAGLAPEGPDRLPPTGHSVPAVDLAPPPADRLQPRLNALLVEPGGFAALRVRGADDDVDRWLLALPQPQVDAFTAILHAKRREHVLAHLPGVTRLRTAAVEHLLEDYFEADPSGERPCDDEVEGLLAFLGTRPRLTTGLADLIRHEAVVHLLSVLPWRPWRTARRELVLHHDPHALDAVVDGDALPEPLPYPLRVRYERRWRGVWCGALTPA